MSLEQTLAQANTSMAAATEALNDVNGRIASVQAAGVAAVTDLASSMVHSLWLDPVGGDDTGTGLEASPLKTLKEVQTRTPGGARVFVFLLGDLVFPENVPIYSHVMIVPAAGVTRPLVAPGGTYVASPGIVWSFGFDMRAGSSVTLRDVRVGLAQWGGSEVAANRACLFKKNHDHDGAMHEVGLIDCEFDPGPSPVGAVNGLSFSMMHVRTPIEIAPMLGRWSFLVPGTAGTDPDTVRGLYTNLAQI